MSSVLGSRILIENLTYLADFEGASSNPITQEYQKVNSEAESHPISNIVWALVNGCARGPLLVVTGIAIHRLVTVSSAYRTIFGSTVEVCTAFGINMVKGIFSSTISPTWDVGRDLANAFSECFTNRPPPLVYIINGLTIFQDAVESKREITNAAVSASVIGLTLLANNTYTNKETDAKQRLVKDLTDHFKSLAIHLRDGCIDNRLALAQAINKREKKIKKEFSILNALSKDEVDKIVKPLFTTTLAIIKKK